MKVTGPSFALFVAAIAVPSLALAKPAAQPSQPAAPPAGQAPPAYAQPPAGYPPAGNYPPPANNNPPPAGQQAPAGYYQQAPAQPQAPQPYQQAPAQPQPAPQQGYYPPAAGQPNGYDQQPAPPQGYPQQAPAQPGTYQQRAAGATPPPGAAYPPGYYPPQPGYPQQQAAAAYPPPGYGQPAVAAQAQRPVGAQEHDGFYFNGRVGGGYLSTSESGFTMSGAGGGVDLAVGGIVSPNLVAFGELFVLSVSDPTVSQDNVSATLTGQTMDLTGIGGGLVYYLMPLNLYLGGSIHAAQLHLSDSETDKTQAQSKWGGAVKLTIGKEWWISDNWGIGAALDLFAARMKDDDGTIGAAGMSLGFSATFN